jgi:hypothetical protein
MRLKSLFIGFFFLSVLPGCGGDSGGQVAVPVDGASQSEAPSADLAALLNADCPLEKFRAGLGTLAAGELRLLERSLEEAIAGTEAEVGRQTVEMQRLSADAGLDSAARALRDARKARSRELVLLKNKRLIVARNNAASSR